MQIRECGQRQHFHPRFDLCNKTMLLSKICTLRLLSYIFLTIFFANSQSSNMVLFRFFSVKKSTLKLFSYFFLISFFPNSQSSNSAHQFHMSKTHFEAISYIFLISLFFVILSLLTMLIRFLCQKKRTKTRLFPIFFLTSFFFLNSLSSNKVFPFLLTVYELNAGY